MVNARMAETFRIVFAMVVVCGKGEKLWTDDVRDVMTVAKIEDVLRCVGVMLAPKLTSSSRIRRNPSIDACV